MTNDSIQPTGSNLPISFPYVYGENIERMYPDVRVSIERITPETAEKMLATNVKNRNIKSAPLETVKEAITNDEWSLNGESIIFDKFGKLSDGQHRLMSCLKTGKPIDAVVVRGVDEEAQDTIDTGTRRQLSDYVKIDGYKNNTVVAAIGKMLMRKDDMGICPTLFDNNRTFHSVKAMRRYIRDCHDERIEPLVPYVRAVTNRYKFVPSHLLSALLDEFRKAGDEDFDEFMAQLTGKSAACMPVRLLQAKLSEHAENNVGGKGKFKNSVLAAYFIKAWNAYMRGDVMKRLTYNPGGANPERFPVVVTSNE